MTEAEWLNCANPAPMLAFVGARLGARPLRLFAVACCRRILYLIDDTQARGAVDQATAQAEGLRPPPPRRRRWRPLLDAAREACYSCTQRNPRTAAIQASSLAAQAICQATYAEILDGYHFEETRRVYASNPGDGESDHEYAHWLDHQEQTAAASARTLEEKAQADLLREIAGNPWRPFRVDPAWLRWNDNCVVRLAAGIEESQRFGDLPILADALLDAGCTDEDLLAHCRAPGPHVRGCCVLDLLLRKPDGSRISFLDSHHL